MAFSGHAVYKSGFLSDIAEDVSRQVSMISPYETPFLDLVGDAMEPAKSVVHDWLEDSLAPNRLSVVANVASATTDTALGVGTGLGAYLQAGMILRGPEAAGAEYMQIISIAGPNTITVSRAFAGTTANSFASTQFLMVISDAATDGADVTVDVSKARPRNTNYTHIFKKDVIISGTSQAVRLHGIDSELDHQITQRLREAMRDLEKAVILSRLSGNTIGSGNAVRTMKGLLQAITTNVTTYTTTTGSATAQFEQDLLNSIETAWQNGGTDLDLMVCGSQLKRQIDQLNASRIRVVNVDNRFGNNIYEFECTYGVYRIMLNRWMPGNYAAIIASKRIAIAPLQGRSFAYIPVAKTGDSEKGMVIGEYTAEYRNEEGMALAKFSNLGQLLTP